jgi:enoyl-[acyl-carrier protein] reductase I
MQLLAGRKGLVVGVANERSIAHGIARSARGQGAELALTFQNERLEKRVRAVAESLGVSSVRPCDLTSDQEVAELAQDLHGRWGRLDFVVHAAAFANRDDLEGRFVDTSRDGFASALDVSVYSLVSLVRALEPLLTAAGSASVLTLSYYGSEKAVPSYNVMGVAKAALEAAVRYLAVDLGPSGVRVNAISAGPIKTLSAAGVRGLREMLAYAADESPLRRNVDIDDVGRAALWAVSDLSSGTTGEVMHVDAGYNILGAPRRKT